MMISCSSIALLKEIYQYYWNQNSNRVKVRLIDFQNVFNQYILWIDLEFLHPTDHDIFMLKFIDRLSQYEFQTFDKRKLINHKEYSYYVLTCPPDDIDNERMKYRD